MVEQCELCHGLRGHKRLQNVFTHQFMREYDNAKAEYDRLKSLWHQVCWYNFEIQCANWMHPWHTSNPASGVSLHGTSIRIIRRNGIERELGTFPCYYSGQLLHAPVIPWAIIHNELLDAEAAVKWWHEQLTAASDWAPGGCKYNALIADPDSGASLYTKLHKRRRRGKRFSERNTMQYD